MIVALGIITDFAADRALPAQVDALQELAVSRHRSDARKENLA
jgi:hypothetical protein